MKRWITKLLQEWRDERARLVSGIAVVKATGLAFHPKTHQRLESTTELVTVFEWKEGLFRFERRYGLFGGQYIRTPTSTVNRRLPDGPAIVSPVGGKPNDYVAAFDIPSVGIATAGALTASHPTLDEIQDWYKGRKPEEIVTAADGRYRIRWSEQAGTVSTRVTVWLNRARGATPEELQVHVRDADEIEWRLTSQTITGWTEMDCVYAPVRWEESRFLPKYGTERSAITVEWRKVNQPVGADKFDVTALGDET